jgi:hypothetical protein
MTLYRNVPLGKLHRYFSPLGNYKIYVWQVLGELEENAKAKCKKIQAQEFSFANK